jgi:hypothetical protein
LLLFCKPMETGIVGNSFFHFCGHQTIQLFLWSPSMALSRWISTLQFWFYISSLISCFF